LFLKPLPLICNLYGPNYPNSIRIKIRTPCLDNDIESMNKKPLFDNEMMLISREYDINYECVNHNIVPKGAIFSLQRENEPNFKVKMQHGWFLWSKTWFGPKTTNLSYYQCFLG
jgi:hypothetical protein